MTPPPGYYSQASSVDAPLPYDSRRALTPPPRSAAAARAADEQWRSVTPPRSSRGSQQRLSWEEQQGGSTSSKNGGSSTPRQHVARLKSHAEQGRAFLPSQKFKENYAGLVSEKFEENYNEGKYITSRGRAHVDKWENDGRSQQRTNVVERRGIGAGQMAAELSNRQMYSGKKAFSNLPLSTSVAKEILSGGDLTAREDAATAWKKELNESAGLVNNYNRNGQAKDRSDKKSQAIRSASAPYLGSDIVEETHSGGKRREDRGKKTYTGHRSAIAHVDDIVFKNSLQRHSDEDIESYQATSGAAGVRPGDPYQCEEKIRGKRILDGSVGYTSASGGNYDWGNVPDDEMRLSTPRGDGMASIKQPRAYTETVRTEQLPTIYISHGPGAMVMSWDKSLPVMRNMARLFEKSGVAKEQVRAILVVSSRWAKSSHDRVDVVIGMQTAPQRLLCDFNGASTDAYETRGYAPFGDPVVSARIERVLRKAGFETEFDKSRYLDSGVWIPMLQMPEFADVPVVQISLPGTRALQIDHDGYTAADASLRMGAALRQLRSEGVLIVGSGQAIKGSLDQENVDKWCRSLKRVCVDAPRRERWGLLQRWQSLPHARQAHPQEENLLPLHVVAGAADGEPGRCLGDFRLGKSAMVHFCFGK